MTTSSKMDARDGIGMVFQVDSGPRRLWKRYLIGNAVFILLVLKEFIKIRLLGRKDV